MLKIQVIIGSTREGRKGEKVAKWVFEKLNADKRYSAELIDLRDYPLEFYHDEMTPGKINGNYDSETARRWTSKIREADGYIFVTPEYNHGYPGVLKNAIDYGYNEWTNKPAAFVSYGGMAGGVRAVEQLRLVLIELQMAPIQQAVPITKIRSAFNENGELTDSSLNNVLQEVFDQLFWWSYVLKEGREKTRLLNEANPLLYNKL
jgi:NAD(P)H-dependent FMN reductase